MRTIFSIAFAAVATVQLAACKDSPLPTRPSEAGPNKLLTIGGGIPVPHPIPIDFVTGITAGSAHTCVLKWSGAVACWGANDWGEIGVPTATQCPSGPCAPQPVTVTGSAGAPSFTSANLVTAGSFHTCALDRAGTAWCWGDGTYGALGNGAGGIKLSPVQVLNGGIPWQTLAAGDEVTCGVSIIKDLFCWGTFPFGRGANLPMFVVNFPFSALAVSSDHVCGGVGPTFWACFGWNAYGQLGVDPAQTPSAPANAEVGVNGATHVAVVRGRTCVDQAGGFVQCFGANEAAVNSNTVFIGMLGNPSLFSASTFQPQTAGAFHGVVVSDTHTCALDALGNAWCWGIGDDGELGFGTSTESARPTMVLGGHTFTALAVGHRHSCGVGTDGHVYCWGDNSFGQLGQPSAGSSSSTPVQAVQP